MDPAVQWGYVSTFYLQMAFPAGVLTLCVLLNLGAQCARDAHMNNSRSALSKLVSRAHEPHMLP